jgi:hypothetical protein
MKNIKTILLAILIFMPFLSFAHGEEVIYTLWIEAVSILIFIVVILAINLNWKEKGILAIVYVLTTSMLLFLTNQIPYRQNMYLINWALILVPVTVTTLSYFYLKPKFQKGKI